MIELCFTHNNLPFSKMLIGSGYKSSHFAIIFDQTWVVHSNHLGCHIEFADAFLEENTVAMKLVINDTLEEEENFYKSILRACYKKPYDWLALVYLTYRSLLLKLFHAPLPLKTIGSSRALLCTEVAQHLPEKIRPPNEADLMVPDNLYAWLKDKLEKI